MTSIRAFVLILFFVSILLVACMPTTADLEPPIDQNEFSNTITSYPAPTVDSKPVPPKALDPYPGPVPTKDQQPIITPWPSPVREEQPTSTALPLRIPSDNSSGNLYLVSSKDNSISEIYAVPVNYGSATVLEMQHKLSKVQLRSSYPPRLHLSPDNEMLAVVESSEHGPGDIVTVINLNQGTASPIGDSRSSEMPFIWRFEGWHPDSRHFLISDADRFKGLWLVDSLGINAPKKLTEHNPDTAAFSPTGQVLTYAYRPELSDQSLLVSAWSDGSYPEIIVQESASAPITELLWSPNGKALAYVVGNTELWLYTEDEQFQLADNYKARYGYAWSPDSLSIAYVARTSPDERPPLNISDLERLMYSLENTTLNIIDLQTSETLMSKHSSETTGAFMPSWSPNGQNVIYTAIQGEKFTIMQLVFDVLGTAPSEKVIVSDSTISAAVWTEIIGEK